MNTPLLNIALIGNPNSGKTTLFNSLTGLRQDVSNLPGTSVSIMKGKMKISHDKLAHITDLPGIYNLTPSSEEEKIAIAEINDKANEYDLFLFTLDATALKRSLFLYSQISNLGIPIIVLLTMKEMSNKMGIEIDKEALANELGVIIVELNTRNNTGIANLKKQIDNKAYGHHKVIHKAKEWETQDTEESKSRHITIGEIIKHTQKKSILDPLKFTKKIDKVITHPFYGFLVFALIMFVVFQTVFNLAAYPMEWIDQGFAFLGNFMESILPNNWLGDIVVNGILPGLSGVIIFLPQIILLFAMLSILEETGYMSRVSFISDKLMRKVGLNGRSVIPMVGGLACAVPSIMACRTIPNKKERLLSMLVLPLMSCSARLPVFILLISLLVSEESKSWIFNTQGVILFALYLLGFFATMVVAYVINFFLKNDEKTSYITDMPLYRMPYYKNIISVVFGKAKVFVLETGKIILIVSIILWALASFGPSTKRKNIESQYAQLIVESPYQSDSLNKVKNGLLLENSFAGIIGKTIEPVIKPMGYDWKLGIGILTSFAAREVFVGTMATIYSLDGEPEDSKLLRDKMRKEINKDTGKSLYGVPLILSLLVFFAFAMQCFSTLAVLYKETGSIKWPIIQFTVMSGLAYFLSILVFQLSQ